MLVDVTEEAGVLLRRKGGILAVDFIRPTG